MKKGIKIVCELRVAKKRKLKFLETEESFEYLYSSRFFFSFFVFELNKLVLTRAEGLF